jgi:hypothetical protein
LLLPFEAFLGLALEGAAGPAVAVATGLAALIFLGRVDARLICRQRGVPLGSPEAGLGWRTATYLMLQVVVILPAMAFVLSVVFLYWAVQSHPYGWY